MVEKKYKIGLNKFYDKDLSTVVMELEITDELKLLIENFTVKDMGTINTQFLKKPYDTELLNSTRENFNRYRIRSVLINTVNNSQGWTPLFDLFFTEEILRDNKIKVCLTDDNFFIDIDRRVSKIKELIQSMESLLSERKILLTLTVDGD